MSEIDRREELLQDHTEGRMGGEELRRRGHGQGTPDAGADRST